MLHYNDISNFQLYISRMIFQIFIAKQLVCY